MRRLVAALLIILGIGLYAAPAAAVADNGTGVFWLYSGANGTGEVRNFNIGPDQFSGAYTSLRYQSNCSGTCDYLNNTVSSVRFSCGSLGTPIDDNDYVRFYDLTSADGPYLTVNPSYPSQCAGGTILYNMSWNGWDNRAGSHVTNE
jgi:hypothetical protein